MIIVKVYEHYWSTEVKHQQYLKQEVLISDDLASFWEAKFQIEWYDISKYNKVEIYEAWNPDVLKFKWFVKTVNKIATILNERVDVVCRSAKWLLQDRGALVGEEEIWTDVWLIVSRMMDRRNTLGDLREYQIDYSWWINMSYQLWASCSWIIQEIADQLDAYWTVRDNKIVISPLIWEDKTYWSWEVEIFFDTTSASNVKEVSEVQSDNRSNVVIWVNPDGSRTLAQEVTDYPYWLKVENFKVWDLWIKTAALLEKENVNKRTIKVVLDESNGFHLNIWDKVKLKIEWLVNISDYTWDVFVIKKTLTYKFWKAYEVVEVWEAVSTESTLSSLIESMNTKIDKLRVD